MTKVADAFRVLNKNHRHVTYTCGNLSLGKELQLSSPFLRVTSCRGEKGSDNEEKESSSPAVSRVLSDRLSVQSSYRPEDEEPDLGAYCNLPCEDAPPARLYAISPASDLEADSATK